MDTVSEELRSIRDRVVIPTSVPGLVTNKLLVMNFLDGVQRTFVQSTHAQTRAIRSAVASLLGAIATPGYGYRRRSVLDVDLLQVSRPATLSLLCRCAADSAWRQDEWAVRS